MLQPANDPHLAGSRGGLLLRIKRHQAGRCTPLGARRFECCPPREPMDPVRDSNRNAPAHARERRPGGPLRRRVLAKSASDIFFDLGMLHVGSDAA